MSDQVGRELERPVTDFTGSAGHAPFMFTSLRTGMRLAPFVSNTGTSGGSRAVARSLGWTTGQVASLQERVGRLGGHAGAGHVLVVISGDPFGRGGLRFLGLS